jgi:23S rRNA (pseudouridine1915-N3)-methyltransferase
MIKVIAPGVMSSGPEKTLIDDYQKRIQKPFQLTAIDTRKHSTREQQSQAILDKIQTKEYVVLLDEHGKNVSSQELLNTITKQYWNLTFIIGGSYGVTDLIKERANLTISFGHMTWPHKLVRVMLIEQIYRCQQIEAQHPYHHS